MYNLHEGENFIPPGLNSGVTNASAPVGSGTAFNSSITSFEMWLEGFLPGLSEAQREELEMVQYPETGGAENLPVYNSSYVRAGLVYRDVVLACPALWMSSAVASDGGDGNGSESGKGYLGTYTISPATHGSDTEWWNQVNPIQQQQPLIYDGFAGAFASFFGTGNPNAHKITDGAQAGVPELGDGSGGEWVIGSEGFTQGGIEMLEGRCEFWRSVADQVPI